MKKKSSNHQSWDGDLYYDDYGYDRWTDAFANMTDEKDIKSLFKKLGETANDDFYDSFAVLGVHSLEKVRGDKMNVERKAINYGNVGNTIGTKAEKDLLSGIRDRNWLHGERCDSDGNSYTQFQVAAEKTCKHDDFENHVDIYAKLTFANSAVVIGFDATTMSSPEIMLEKMDHGIFNGFPVDGSISEFPFGFSAVEYYDLDNEKKSLKVPLYRIAIDSSKVKNEQVYGEEDYSGEDLTTSFLVLSQMHEQNLLIKKRSEKQAKKNFKVYPPMNDKESQLIDFMDEQIWGSLCDVMDEMYERYDGGNTDYYYLPDTSDQYNRYKTIKSIYSGKDLEGTLAEEDFNAIEGFRMRPDKAYAEILHSIETEMANDKTIIRYIDVQDGNRANLAGTIEDLLAKYGSYKQLISRVPFPSFWDNLDDLLKLSEKGNSGKIIGAIENRLKMGHFIKEEGIFDGGLREDGSQLFTGDTLPHLYDGCVEKIFKNEEILNKYFKKKEALADCLSPFYVKRNAEQLRKWGVSEALIKKRIYEFDNPPKTKVESN